MLPPAVLQSWGLRGCVAARACGCVMCCIAGVMCGRRREGHGVGSGASGASAGCFAPVSRQVPRRNYPMAVARAAYAKRGPLYSNKAVVVRSVRRDQSGITVALHYLNDGNARLRFSLKKQEFFVPVVLLIKSLVDITDQEVYELVCG